MTKNGRENQLAYHRLGNDLKYFPMISLSFSIMLSLSVFCVDIHYSYVVIADKVVVKCWKFNELMSCNMKKSAAQGHFLHSYILTTF